MDLRTREPQRRGFTLVEILVVIAIIAILAALASWAVFAMVGSQQSRNTYSTMKVLKDILNKHWQYVIEEADKETPSPAVMAMANYDIGRAKVIWRKVRLVEAFPQQYAEIASPWVYTLPSPLNPYIPPGQHRYNADYVSKLSTLVPAGPSLTQSSACLRIALSVKRTGTALSDDLIKFAIKDTDGDGINEIVDGWGNSMAFFRFAWNDVGLIQTIPAGGKKVYADPTDPDGTLVNPGWYYSPLPPNRMIFEQLFHPAGVIKPANPAPPGTLPYPVPPGALPTYPVPPGTPIENPAFPGKTGYRACYVAPVIVSAGKDGFFGLTVNPPDPPSGPLPPQQSAQQFASLVATLLSPDMSVANPRADNKAPANDNIYSFQVTGN